MTMYYLSTPNRGDGYRLLALRSAVKIEIAGMKRRGPSAASIAKTELGLKKSMKTVDVLAFLNAQIDELGLLTP